MDKNSELEQDSEFLRIGRDVHSLILSWLPMPDAINVATTCKVLWKNAQPTLLQKLLAEAHEHGAVEGLSYLTDALSVSSLFQTYRIHYPHLAQILSRAKPILDTIVKSDPLFDWKIAAICGLEEAVAESLGENIATMRDFYGRGVMDYYALGGQLECLKRFVQRHYPPREDEEKKDPSLKFFDHAQVKSIPSYSYSPADQDPDCNLPIMAALGGQVPVLQYLSEELGYDLKAPLPRKSPEGYEENLLTYAAQGGDEKTYDFLIAQGVKPSKERNPAFYAAENGHWRLYEKIARTNNPIQTKEDAITIAKDAVRTGNLKLALQLIEEHEIDPQKLNEEVLKGGQPQVFWHFIENGFLDFTQTFSRDETIAHCLAQEGHLSLLKKVLRDKRAEHCFTALDNEGQSLLHYAAAGGNYHIYTHLKNSPASKKLATHDRQNRNSAHVAAEEGMLWFLWRLNEDEPKLLLEKDRFKNTLLHKGAFSANPYFLSLIIESFGIDLRAENDEGDLLVHCLAELASETPYCWNTLQFIVERFDGFDMLDFPNNAARTVKDIIQENHAEEYFPEGFLTQNPM